MKEHYITLLSNSSLNLYPNNKTGSFKVQLPRKITLSEKCVVGLAEIQFPYNFYNVTLENNLFTFFNGKQRITDGIHLGFYNNVYELVEAVLQKTRKYYGNWLVYDNLTNRIKVVWTDEAIKAFTPPKIIENKAETVSVDIYNKIDKSFLFHGRLATQLGFIPDEDVFEYVKSPSVGNVYFGIPDQMFIYCDIVEPQIIGLESCQVIKIVNTTNSEVKFGTPCHRDFHRLHYIPVLKKEFDGVEIHIRDITGELFPFRHGVVSVKLHFKDSGEANSNQP